MVKYSEESGPVTWRLSVDLNDHGISHCLGIYLPALGVPMSP